ncbi:MAG: branched-chain amino acid ABC transporter permease [Prochloraceae cyanobacterium]|nr:branched-chain amino acid ABC transporter permease [Prochloraceae cyanobacterium]
MLNFIINLSNNSGYIVSLTILTSVFAIFALGLNLQWGFSGLINFGHIAFMTIGAYTTVMLSLSGVPLIVAVIIGAGLAALLGFFIGISTLRLREDYLAIVTIGVSELVRLVANNEEWLTRGVQGVRRYQIPFVDWEPGILGKVIAIALLTGIAIFAQWQLLRGIKNQFKEYRSVQNKSYQPTKPIVCIIWGAIATIVILFIYINGIISLYNYHYQAGLMVLALLILALVYSGLEILVRSPWGRVIKAIREDEEIARALGKNVFFYKLQAFMLGGAIAGVAGSFYAWQLNAVYPTSFEPLQTFNAWIIVVVGGAGNNPGTILGAIIFWTYDAVTRFLLPQLGIDNARLSALRIMVIGLILMILVMWRPQGILGKKEELTLGK